MPLTEVPALPRLKRLTSRALSEAEVAPVMIMMIIIIRRRRIIIIIIIITFMLMLICILIQIIMYQISL